MEQQNLEQPDVLEIPDGLPQEPPVQEEPMAGLPRGYVRMAVMDGKTITHRVRQ